MFEFESLEVGKVVNTTRGIGIVSDKTIRWIYVCFPSSFGWDPHSRELKGCPPQYRKPVWSCWAFLTHQQDGVEILGYASWEETKKFKEDYPLWNVKGLKHKSFENNLLRFNK